MASKKQMPRWHRVWKKFIMENICEWKWDGIQDRLGESSGHSANLIRVRGWKEGGSGGCILDTSTVVRKVQEDHWAESVPQRVATLQKNGPALLFLWHWAGGWGGARAGGQPMARWPQCRCSKGLQNTAPIPSIHPSYKVTNPGSQKEFQEVYININNNRWQ